MGGLIASIVGLVQFLLEIINTGEVHRVYGWHGPAYGAVMASILLLSISALLYQQHKIFKLWAIITIPFAGLALILCQTRAWIGALVLAIVIMFILEKQGVFKRVLLIIGIVVSIIVLVLIIAGLGIIDSKYFLTALDRAFRFGSTPGKHSIQDFALLMRLNVWRAAMVQYFNHPIFGIGVGNLRFVNYFTPTLVRPSPEIGWVDNQYIQFFTEAGTIAGIAWIMFVSRSVRLGIQSVRQAVGSDLYAPAIGFFMSLLILFIGSFFWVITPQHELFASMALNIGLLFNIHELSKKSSNGAAIVHYTNK
jgi:O-antigen ligase